MREDCIAKRSVGHPTEHSDLHAAHNLACTHPERCEPKDAITVGFHQALEKSARLHETARAQHRRHRHLEKTVGNPLRLRFLFGDSDAREFGIRK